MRSGLSLGVDVGTGSAKAVVFDSDEGVLGHGSAGYETSFPHDGWAEHDPNDWWLGVCKAVRLALDAAGRHGADVAALSFSAMGGATVFVDDHGWPVVPSPINLDRRAVAEHEELRAGPFADAVAAASGNSVGAWNVGVKTRWFMNHRPSEFSRTRLITSPAGYLLRRCTGRPVQSVSDAGIFDLFDLRERNWSSAACEHIGIDPALLPDVVDSLAVVGELTPTAASDLGVPMSCVVVAGAEDTPAAALAAGVTDLDTCYVSLGTAGVVGVVTSLETTAQPRVLRFPHVTPHLDVLSGSMSAAGAAMNWLSGIVGETVTALLDKAESVPAGSGGVTFLPYLAGELHPVNDPQARAIFAGMSVDTTTAHLARAVLEGSANAITHNLDVIAEVTNLPETMRATGRPTESSVWCQSIADATGRRLETVATEGAPLGAAMLAAATSDSELNDLVSKHVVVRGSFEPDGERTKEARDRWMLTNALYETSRDARRNAEN